MVVVSRSVKASENDAIMPFQATVHCPICKKNGGIGIFMTNIDKMKPSWCISNFKRHVKLHITQTQSTIGIQQTLHSYTQSKQSTETYEKTIGCGDQEAALSYSQSSESTLIPSDNVTEVVLPNKRTKVCENQSTSKSATKKARYNVIRDDENVIDLLGISPQPYSQDHPCPGEF